jgi:hypothetical protein
MKYIITESKYYNLIDGLIKEQGIEVYYQFLSHGYNSLTGTVRLYKDGEVLGRRDGYDFYYKFDQRFGDLTYEGHFPNIENVDIFKYLPENETIKYFSNHLVEQIKKDVSYLFKK